MHNLTSRTITQLKIQTHLLIFRPYIFVFMYFDDNNNMKIELTICVVDNKL